MVLLEFILNIKYEIVERLQKMGHTIGMTGDGVNDAPALSKANVGVAVADASDAARSAADIVLTEPGLSVIIEGNIYLNNGDTIVLLLLFFRQLFLVQDKSFNVCETMLFIHVR